MQGEDIVRVATATNPAEAHVWQQALEEEGIASKVVGDYMDAGIGDIPGLQAEIWVHRNDLERASAFLEAHRHRSEATDAEED